MLLCSARPSAFATSLRSLRVRKAMVQSNPRGQGGLEFSGCLRSQALSCITYHAPSIKHHVDDVLWSFDSVLTTLKGAHDDESDGPMSPDESAPASRQTHARHNPSQRLSLLSGR